MSTWDCGVIYCSKCRLGIEHCICAKPGQLFKNIKRAVIESSQVSRMVKSWKSGTKEIVRK